MHRAVRILVGVPLAAALLSCGGGGDGPTVPPPPVVDLNAVSAITVTAPSSTVVAGGTMTLTGVATNVNGTQLAGRVFTWSTSNAAIATVDGNGTVVGVAPGTVDITAAIGAKSNKVTLTITPGSAAASIAASGGNGQSATINTAVAAPPSVIITDGAGGPVSGVTVTFAVTPGGGSVTGANQVTNSAGIAAVGGWVMGPTAGPQTLTATSGTPLSGSPVTFTATATPLPSNMRQFNITTRDGCDAISLRTGEIKAQTQHVTIVADLSNPSGGFTDADYQSFATTVESLHWPVLTENFGVPSDIDTDGRIVAFFTSAVNDLTPRGANFFVGGFFFVRDLLPRIANPNIINLNCPGSNVTEMFYLLAPDPAGTINGNIRPTDFVRRVSLGTIGHEMQHLINASRRIYVNNAEELEDLFMDEGLAHIAEELLFLEASGLRPRSNIASGSIPAFGSVRDAYNLYATANFGRFREYQLAPAANSPYADDDDLATRGATWAWLRYLADRGGSAAVAGPTCGPTIALSVNATCRLEGAGAAQLALDGGSSGSEYTIVAFNETTPALPVGASISLATTATNTITPTGPPNPSTAPAANFSQAPAGGLQPDLGFHARLHETGRQAVAPRLRHARARFGRQSRGLPTLSKNQAPVRTSFSAAFVEPVWGRLVNRNAVGLNNLRAEFGQDVLGAARDWAVAHYTDDAVAASEAQYTHPSWNFRSVISPFPLLTQGLGGSPITLVAGGATYYRLGIAPSTSSAVTFTVSGAAPPGTLKLVVVRTK